MLQIVRRWFRLEVLLFPLPPSKRRKQRRFTLAQQIERFAFEPLESRAMLYGTITAQNDPMSPGGVPGSDERPEVLEEFDVASGGDVIVVPVSVGEKHCQFMLDTGFSCCCVNARHSQSLGKPLGKVTGTAPGGTNWMERFQSPTMRLGRIPLRPNPEIGSIDLSSMECFVGRQVDGILGMDALAHLVLNIDFEAGKVRVLTSAKGAVGRRLPIIWHQRKHMREGPFIKAMIDGDLPCEFLVDTGAARSHFGSLDGQPFDFLQSEKVIRLLPGEFSVFSPAGRVTTRFGRLRRLSIASYEHEDVLIERVPFWNTLGLGFLSRYVATFDFPASAAYLAPSRSFGSPEPINRSGLTVDRKDSEVVITNVRDGSPGQEKGTFLLGRKPALACTS